jgi:hypothetical protein
MRLAFTIDKTRDRSSRGHLVPRRATALAGQEAAGILRCEKFGTSSKVT